MRLRPSPITATGFAHRALLVALPPATTYDPTPLRLVDVRPSYEREGRPHHGRPYAFWRGRVRAMRACIAAREARERRPGPSFLQGVLMRPQEAVPGGTPGVGVWRGPTLMRICIACMMHICIEEALCG